MFSRFRARFGTPGVVIAVIALVFAMAGGAYAAGGGLSGKQKKEVEKIAKKVSKPGPAGKQGPAGPAGPAGAAGAKGDAGAKGEKGEKGDKGDKGEKGERGEKGEEGPEGPEGAEGSPWPGGGILASKATEVGSWGTLVEATGLAITPLTFSIQLPGPIDETKVHVIEGTPNANCPGSSKEPKALPGHLCVYVGLKEGGVTSIAVQDPAFGDGGSNLVSRAGAVLNVEGPAESFAMGTFAVTAP